MNTVKMKAIILLVFSLLVLTIAIDHREKHFLKRNALLSRFGGALENSVLGQSAYQGSPSSLVSSALGTIAGAGPVNVIGHEIQSTFTRHLGIPFSHQGVPVQHKFGFKTDRAPFLYQRSSQSRWISPSRLLWSFPSSCRWFCRFGRSEPQYQHQRWGLGRLLQAAWRGKGNQPFSPAGYPVV